MREIEDIAQEVGINRAIIYRHFSGKEELFAMALVGYLDELDAELAQGRELVGRPVGAIGSDRARVPRLRRAAPARSSTAPSPC